MYTREERLQVWLRVAALLLPGGAAGGAHHPAASPCKGRGEGGGGGGAGGAGGVPGAGGRPSVPHPVLVWHGGGVQGVGEGGAAHQGGHLPGWQVLQATEVTLPSPPPSPGSSAWWWGCAPWKPGTPCSHRRAITEAIGK